MNLGDIVCYTNSGESSGFAMLDSALQQRGQLCASFTPRCPPTGPEDLQDCSLERLRHRILRKTCDENHRLLVQVEVRFEKQRPEKFVFSDERGFLAALRRLNLHLKYGRNITLAVFSAFELKGTFPPASLMDVDGFLEWNRGRHYAPGWADPREQRHGLAMVNGLSIHTLQLSAGGEVDGILNVATGKHIGYMDRSPIGEY